MNDIFISFKYHDQDGNVLPDYYKARELCAVLRNEGFSVFFSDDSIVSAGRADYTKVIDENLESSKVLIVVSSCSENCNAGWVRYEWDSFYSDILSDKKEGMLLSFIEGAIAEYPRSIRTNQSFPWTEDGVFQIVEIIRNYFKSDRKNDWIGTTNKERKKGSSYNYKVGDEKRRLKVQAKLECEKDKVAIAELISKINRSKINVLDVGCSMGSLTKLIFGGYKDKVNVLGVDKFKECIDGFNSLFQCDNFHAELLNLDESDWTSRLEAMMRARGIDKFDIVYCSMSLHHMADSNFVVKKLWSLMRNNGYIYVRTSDDNLKIAYPDSDGIVSDIISLTSNVPGIADRYHGRKIYRQLAKAKFTDIKVDHYSIDTANKSQIERDAIFTNTFSWRKNYFIEYLNQVSNTGDQTLINEALEKYNKVVNNIDTVEDYFSSPDFYFAFFVTTAIGRKVAYIDEETD